MIPGKWYVTDPDTRFAYEGPFDEASAAEVARSVLERTLPEKNYWVTKWDVSRREATTPPATPEWYASTNGEHYTTGPFDTREQAIQEMLIGYDETRFYTGRAVPLTLEELVHVDVEGIEERAYEQGYDVVGNYIEDWKFGFTGLVKANCQAAINAAVVRILGEFGVCGPGCYRVVDVEEYGKEASTETGRTPS